MKLSLIDIVKVIVDISPKSAARAGFNIGMVVGESGVIPVTERIRLYTNLSDMLTDGFASSSPEYEAASLYFSQAPAPSKLVVGAIESTEDLVEAITDCRNKNADWYAFTYCGATLAAIKTLAAWTESAKPSSAYFYTAGDKEVFASLKELNYFRSHGMYSLTTPDAVASVMGYAMGANTQLNNSAYTLAYKRLPGVAPESITENEIAAIKEVNGNIYVARGNTYYLYEQGWQANGASFDELLNLDQLANNVQLSVMDLLVSRKKVPQTEDGVSNIVAAITPDFEKAVNIGFLAPGIWNGPQVLGLETGDALPKGYAILSETIAEQSQADRDARKAPNIYCPIKLAGAIEHVIIQIPVNR